MQKRNILYTTFNADYIIKKSFKMQKMLENSSPPSKIFFYLNIA